MKKIYKLENLDCAVCAEKMKNEAYEACVKKYEEVYQKKLSYEEE